MNTAARNESLLADIGEAELESVICSHATVILAFVRHDEVDSIRFSATLAEAARRHPDFFFGQIDGVMEQHLTDAFRVTQLPTLLAIREQILVIRRSGNLEAPALQSLLEQVRLLDMDDIRTEIAAVEGDEDAIDW